MNDHRDQNASRLAIDYRNAMAAAVGPAHGVTDAMLDEIAPVVAEQHARLAPSTRLAVSAGWSFL